MITNKSGKVLKLQVWTLKEARRHERSGQIIFWGQHCWCEILTTVTEPMQTLGCFQVVHLNQRQLTILWYTELTVLVQSKPGSDPQWELIDESNIVFSSMNAVDQSNLAEVMLIQALRASTGWQNHTTAGSVCKMQGQLHKKEVLGARKWVFSVTQGATATAKVLQDCNPVRPFDPLAIWLHKLFDWSEWERENVVCLRVCVCAFLDCVQKLSALS